MTRIEDMRIALDWSQAAMGQCLGVSQRVVWSIEAGKQDEPGALATVLDLLASALASGVARKGMTPQDARARLAAAIAAAGNAEQGPAAGTPAAPQPEAAE